MSTINTVLTQTTKTNPTVKQIQSGNKLFREEPCRLVGRPTAPLGLAAGIVVLLNKLHIWQANVKKSFMAVVVS